MTGKAIMMFVGLVALLAAFSFSCAQREAIRPDETQTMAAQQAQAEAVPQKHADVDFSVSCLECHQETTPEPVAEWSAGMHGQVNVGCFICHGDGEAEFYAKPADDGCVTCHSAKEVDFSRLEATSCFSCHGGHSLKLHE
jgi:uncharacterized CHY-type Zn-finger protein